MDFEFDVKKAISESIDTKQKLAEVCAGDIFKCGLKLAEALKDGHKILFCGNGGSAADSQHLAAELVVRLRGHVNRPALPAIALTVDPSIMTAGGNDIGFENVFAREVEAYGQQGDILIGISTSGNSENVLRAVEQAKKQGLTTIGLLGNEGGKIAAACDFSVVVPSKITARIQESHILIGHIWCEMIEEFVFPEFFRK
jgi:D-sedoheptulose 7-phosphate isomerase